MVILFHGWFNFFSVSSAGVGSATVMRAVIVFWVVRTVRVYGLTNPAPAEKKGVLIAADILVAVFLVWRNRSTAAKSS